MDIAKYVTTAGVLSTVFVDLYYNTYIAILAIVTIILTLLLGLWFIKEENKHLTKKGG